MPGRHGTTPMIADGRPGGAAMAGASRTGRWRDGDSRAVTEFAHGFSLPFRALALVLATLVGVTALSLAPTTPAEAVVVEWGTNGGTAPNYQATVNGDFLVAGNGVLACDSIGNQAGYGTCAGLHQATQPASNPNNNVNDAFRMNNSNTVPGFTTNSSSATLTVPPGATVTKAFLNWSANTGTYAGQTTPYCSATGFGTATLPAGSATGYQTRAVQLKVGAGAITSFTPASIREDATTQATARYYSASADVTGAFAGVTTGSSILVSAGNIWAPNGPGCYAGWSLTVIYDYGTYIPGNLASTPHRVLYYEGHVRQGASDAPLTVNYSGFTAVDTGTRASFTLYEGDRGIAGDTASYARGGSTTFTQIANSAGATGNFGIGRAEGSVRYTQTADTSTFTNQSVDVDAVSLPNVVAGDSQVSLRLATSGDSYLLTNSTLSVPIAGLDVKKTFDGTADAQYRTSGERATFTITLTNTGAGTLNNIQITDDQVDCTRALTGVTLAPLASLTITCTATNLTTTSYTSTASATATTVNGGYLASDSDSTNVVLSAIGLTKASALAAGATGRAGDTLNYTFIITNTGGGTLTGVTLADPLPGLGTIAFGAWPSGTAGTLGAGQSVTATAPYTLTQTDVDAGSIANTATTSGADQDGGPRPTTTAPRTTPITSAPALSLTKTPSVTSGARVGDSITYTFVARNTGNVTLRQVAISDPLPGLSSLTYGAWPGGVTGTLAPGAQVTATATYTVRQSDVDQTAVRNTASVTGTPPTGAAVTASSGQVSVPTIAAAPSLSTWKSASYTTGSGAVGSVITYSFILRNTGNVTITGAAIADPLAGLSAISYGTWPGGTAGTLAPGTQVTATATKTVTQADVDAGSVANTATGSGTAPSGAAVSAPSPTVTTPTQTAAPALTLTKSGSAAGSTAGSTVTYTFTLRNAGNVTLTGAGISDPLPGLSALSFGTWPSGTAGTLAPGQQVTATATYALKQSDIDAGSVANTATATGKPPTGANVTTTRSATVPITPSGALAVTKSGAYTSGTGAVGSVIRFTIGVRNSGNVTLTQVSIADSLAGLPAPTVTWPGTAGTLTPGQTATATADYTVTQADADAGSVRNIATATGRTPAGATATGTSPEAVVPTAAAAPGVTVAKTGVIAGGAAGNAGDVITYSFTIRNTGNVTLTGVAVADPLAGLGTLAYTWPGAAGTLAPGQSATATANYTIKQADVDAGNVRNTATVSGTTPSGGSTTGSSGQVTTPTAAAAPAITTLKSGALATGATGVAGDVVTWTITLRNSGNTTLTGVAAADSLAGISALTYTWPGTAGTLTPGQTATARGTYVLTQADVDAGSVANIATGSGRAPAGQTVSSTAPATVPVAAVPALSITKTPSISSGARVGDVITYTFVVRNAGNVTLRQVSAADPLPGLSALSYGAWPGGTAGTLAPGAQVTATATYTVRQADVDAGSVRNTASATGTPPTGAAVTASSGQITVTTVAAAPALTTTKTAAYTTGSGAVGSVITYSFLLRNTGNTTLTSVSVADPLPGLGTISYPGGFTGSLAPGASVTATATYRVTQADVDRGSIANTATGSGTAPSGTVVTAPSAAVTTPTQAAAPAITLSKSGTAGGTTAGSTVTYSFTLANSGNVTLRNAAIADPLPGLSAISYGTWPSGTAGVLAPGQSITASATYTLTQADVDAGSVANTATGTASPPSGAAISRTASATVPVAPTGTLAVTKSGTYTSGSGAVGSVIRFEIAIANTGNVTLRQVTLDDSLAGLSAPVIVWPGTAGTLGPGQRATATATYTVTQADVDAGVVRNTASATARTPGNVTVSASSPVASVPTSAAAGAVTIAKSGVVAGGAAGNAGDVIAYSFTLRNSGNVTLTGVAAADPLPGLSGLTYSWPGTAGVLAPGQSATATASYTITQADVDAGGVRNTASVTGTTPSGTTVTGSSGAVTTPTAAGAPAIATTKSGSLAAGAARVAGDVVTWSFTVRNSGNQTLTAVAIADPLPGISALAYTWPGPAGTLAPGQTATATATYSVTQADVDAGSVVNTATGSGTPPTGPAVSNGTSATVPLTARPALSVTKTPSATSGLRVDDTVTYSFLVRNTGNVTLRGVAVADPLPGLGAVAYPGGFDGTLGPGATVTATATYRVTQADVDAGQIRNTATASGTPPVGAAVTAASAPTTVTTIAAAPALTTAKTATFTSGSGGVGSVIEYRFTVRNSGNVTLTGVRVADPLPGLGAVAYPGGFTGTLAPGASVVATAQYLVTQADVDRGEIRNQATATGTPPSGADVTGPSPAVVTPLQAASPSIAVTKTGSASGVTAGSTVTYSVAITNTGNVTLTGVGITDPLLGGAVTLGPWPGGTPGTLAPGERVPGTATYTVSQADVDAGAVANTATGTGTPPTGTAVTRAASATVPLAANGALSLAKSSRYTSGSGGVGSVIEYTLIARNTGNVTLTGVAISDPLPGLSAPVYGAWPSGTTGTLGAGQQVTATATYTVTQADVDRGSVSNTARVAGRAPSGTAVGANSPTVDTPTAAAAPGILAGKTAVVSGGGTINDRVTYTLTAQNTGNTTLTGVVISDPQFTPARISYGSWPSGTAGVLRPGDTVTATASRTITQTDVDAGAITNTARSEGTPPSGPRIGDDSDTVVTPLVTRAPAIDLTQSGALAGGALAGGATGRAGDVVTWTFTVANPGNVSLTGVGIAPQLPGISAVAFGPWPGAVGVLAPGQSVTATATYVLTQADVDRGSVTDPATATGTGAGSTVNDSDPATVTYRPTSSIVLSKSGLAGGDALEGDTITYSFTARNTGDTTLTLVEITDAKPGVSALQYPPGFTGTLVPGESVTGTATYVITLDDVNAGVVLNTGTVTARTPDGDQLEVDSDPNQVATGAARRAIDVTKTVSSGAGGRVGDEIVYELTATNIGQVSLGAIEIIDPLFSDDPLPLPDDFGGRLDPGDSVAVKVVHVITQADVDRGYVDNRASAAGTTDRGEQVSEDTDLVRTPTVGAAPGLTLTKSGSTPSPAAVGNPVSWSFTLANSGNQTLTGVDIADALPGVSDPVVDTWPGAVGVLAPGQSVTATASSAVTQADIDAGSIVNSATATGTPPSGSNTTTSASATVRLTTPSSMSLDKSETVSGTRSVGDTITYTFTARNTGTTTLRAVRIADPLPGLSALAYVWPGVQSVLAPGQVVTATATYRITQADVDAGSIINAATVRATAPDNSVVGPVSSPTVTTPLAPQVGLIAVTKLPDILNGAEVGTVIRYTIEVRNTGNVTLRDVVITDQLTGVDDLVIAWPGAVGVLAPGQVATATASYVVTQADVDAGQVVNTVTATGRPPRGDEVTAEGSASTETEPAAPAIDVTDSGALAAGATGVAGDVVTWTYVVTNTGNVTLTGVSAAEQLAGASAPDYAWPGTPGVLAPGESVTVTTTYPLSQADVDAGGVTSRVSTSGLPPNGADPGDRVTDAATARVDVARDASLAVVKSGAVLAPGIGQVGDTVRYVLEATNTGNVTLYQGALLDPLPGLGVPTITWPDPARPGFVPVGSTVRGEADYVLTQADVDRGYVDNQADVEGYTTESGRDPANRVTAPSNDVRVPTVQDAPRLVVTKTGAPTVAGRAGVGDTVTWTIRVENTGNVTLTGVELTESLALQAVTGSIPTELAPGASGTITGTITLTQADVDRGSIENTADAEGVSARDGALVVADPATAVVPTNAAAARVDVTTVATRGAGWSNSAGDLVDIEYTLTNTGNTTLTALELAETLGLVGGIQYTQGDPGQPLPPGGVLTARGQYRVTQADVDRGSITNTVTGSGQPPRGADRVTDTASSGVTIDPSAGMVVRKDGTLRPGPNPGGAGSVIDYAFEIENTGNVTLSLVDLVDALPGVSAPDIVWPDPARPSILPPGEIATATATYTITQADVDRGTVGNQATASGKPPVGDTIFISSPLETTTVAPAAPALVVVKTADPTTGVRVGDLVDYRIEARNSGNVTLTGVSVADPLPGLSALVPDWPGAAGTLAPGETVVFTGSYRAQQADVDAGSIVNLATVSGAPPTGARVSASDDATSATEPAGPSIAVTDAGALAPGATGVAGDRVIWTYTITNDGNVTLRGVDLAEALTGASPPVFGAWPGAVGVLAPGESVTATAEYVLTQADVDAGRIGSAITTTGLPPGATDPADRVNDRATAEMSIAARPGYTVQKSAELLNSGTGAVGDTVRYRVEVLNTGNVTLYRGTLVDPLPGLGTPTITWPGEPGIHPPGTVVTGVADYVLTQADVDRGYVDNTATVSQYTTSTAQPGETPIPVDSNPVRVPTVEAAPRLVVTKTASPAAGVAVGDVVTWTVTVRNAGNVTVDRIAISDSLALDDAVAPWPTLDDATLAPGEQAVLTGTTTVTQEDVDAGAITNIAGASGVSARDGGAVDADPAASTVRTVGSAPAIEIVKSARILDPVTNRVGDIVEFRYVATNTGNTTLTGVTLADELGLLGPIDYSQGVDPASVAPGEVVIGIGRYRLTQADIDRGSLSSAVTVTGTPPSGPVVSDTDTAGVVIVASPSLAVQKNGALRSGGGVGTAIDFSFRIENTGNTTLTLVDLVDALGGVSDPVITWPVPARPGVLLPGEVATATADYTITQSDVDRGSVSNQATAIGKPPVGDTITQTSNTSVTPVQPTAPELTATKTASPASGLVVGDVITYALRVENTGNTTITGVTLDDPLVGAVTARWPGAVGVLAPGQAATASPTYRVTQTDVDRGFVDNTLTTAGRDPSGAEVGDSASARATTAAAAPVIQVTDAGVLAPGSTGEAGDVITWTYVVTNSGNVTLTGVTVAEALSGASTPTVVAWPGTVGVLAPGQSVTFTSTYPLSQADVDAGGVTSRVSTSGLPPGGADPGDRVTDAATAQVPVAVRPALAVVKSGSVLAPGIGQVGDRVRYVLEATNTGNVTLYQGALLDPLPGLGVPRITWPDPARPGFVPVGSTVRGEADYVLTQADVDRGYIDNQADVEGYTTESGRDPANRVTAASNDVRVPTIGAAPQLAVAKSASPASGLRVGDTVTFTITTSNPGNVTVTGVAVSDPLPGLSALTTTWPGTAGVLAPGEQASSSGTYTVTQADVDAGSVRNTASASGASGRDGAPVTASSPQLVTPTVAAAPALTVTDAGALASPSDARAGGTVLWTYRITNTGNVTLSGVAAAERLPGATAPVYAWPGAPGVLPPGGFVDVTTSYVLSQADVDAGSVISIVDARGTPPTGAPATATASATVLVDPAPALSLVKTGALATAGENGVGDGIRYSFELRNGGNVTLRDVQLSDTLAGLSIPVITWPTAEAGVLPPGTAATATAGYQISQTDVDAGRVDNRAGATGTPPTGPAVTTQSALVSIPTETSAPGIAVTKSGALRSGTGNAGSVVRFTFQVRNTGNTTLTDVTLTDRLAGVGTPVLTFPAAPGTLTPGAIARGIADYTLTQADVDRGYVDNIADAAGTGPGGAAVAAPSNTFRFPTAAPAPAIVTTQSGAFAAGQTGVLGDTVEYVFRIENTGNVTLTDVQFAATVGPLAGLVYTWPTGVPGVLPPGTSVTLRADYTVTQADVDAGVVRNVESGRGTSPAGVVVRDDADEVVLPLATASTELALTKTGTPRAGAGVGDTVDYTLTLTNAGTQTLRSAAITDGLAGASPVVYGTWPTGTAGVLPPGGSVTATVRYVLTQADVDRGSVVNTASASARTPAGDPVTTTARAEVATAAAAPAIDLTKTAALGAGATGRAGDPVEYRFEVVNTGNVTLTGVTLGDDQPGIGGLTYVWPGTPGVLLPGERLVATATYPLTQADVDAGQITSTATTSGTGARGGSVGDEQTVTLPIAASPALRFDKTATPPTTPTAGSVVRYDFSLTNTGSVTLQQVSIADPLLPPASIVYRWPGAFGVLAPGETVTASGAYALTQADIESGALANTATASGASPAGAAVTAVDSAVVPLPNGADVGLVMSAAIADGRPGFAGDRIVYTYVITNTGNRTLTDVTLIDGKPGLGPIVFGAWPGEVGVLLPGQSVIATAEYVITPADEGKLIRGSADVLATGATVAQRVSAEADVNIQLPVRPDPGVPGTPGRPGGGLASTGIDPALPGGAAALLVLWGLLLIVAGARRRTRHPEENA